MGSKSPLSITAMADARTMRNLSRRTSADTGTGGRTEVSTTLPLDNACRMLLLELKAGGLVLVFCASDGDFMAVVAAVVVVINCCFSE
jgi:hypothetical protein